MLLWAESSQWQLVSLALCLHFHEQDSNRPMLGHLAQGRIQAEVADAAAIFTHLCAGSSLHPILLLPASFPHQKHSHLVAIIGAQA